MQDAFGGILNIVLVAVFLVIVEGILGFTVNYTKAFRMKNIVISSIEKYEASPSCFGGVASGDSDCRKSIQNGAKGIGYHPSDLRCPTGYTKSDDFFCYKLNYTQVNKKYVYSVVTQVDINIPIINKMMGLSFFQVNGDTRAFEK